MSANFTLSLQGNWYCKLDRKDCGIEESWYNSTIHDYELTLPGTTASNGIGEPLDFQIELTKEAVKHLRQKFKYVGAAWYQKKITIPNEWQNKNINLYLERVMFQSRVWIDNKEVGVQDNLSTCHSYDITEFVDLEKEFTLTIRIDNRDVQNINTTPSAYTDETQTIWNGIVGNLELVATDKLSINYIDIYPNIYKKSAIVKVYIDNLLNKATDILVSAAVYESSDPSKKPIGTPINLKHELQDNKIEFEYFLGDNINLWDEFNPFLYKLDINISATPDGLFKDNKTVSFGMRDFKAKGTNFLVNDKKIMLRGTLDCCIFPLTGYPPTDKEAYLKIFKVAKEYGLNHIRFHSWCPPTAAFDAADEVGLYLNIEGPMWLDTYMVKKVGSDKEHYVYFPEEAKRIIKAYGNHPSFCMYSNGNELGGDFDLLHDMIASLKEKDTRRVYTLTTNWDRKADECDDYFAAQSVDKVGIRGQYYLDKMVEGTELEYSNAVSLRDMPLVSHEIGQYVVYPHMKEIDKYTGVLSPVNFLAIKKDLEDKNLLKYAEDFTLGSGELAAILYKDEIEAALRTPGFGGFQLLDLHDFPGQSTATVGLLNSFWESKGIITAEKFREFCSPVVPLLVMKKRIYKNSDLFEAEFQIANYGEADLKNIKLNWQIGTNFSGSIPVEYVAQGELIQVGSISNLSFKDIKEATELEIRLTIEDTQWSNAWKIWIYPDIIDSKSEEATLFETGNIAIHDNLNSSVIKDLEEGKNVLLLCQDYQVRNHFPGKFFPVFWSPVHFISKDPCGIICKENHGVFSKFPTGKYVNYQWKDLLENSFSIGLEDVKEDLDLLVQVIPNFFNNHKLTSLFESKVLNGKLMVCSFDIQNNLENRPVAAYLKRSILEYMIGETFNPSQEINLDTLYKIFLTEEELIETQDSSKNNIALGKKAKSDSEKSPSYAASCGNDGDLSSYWCAKDTASGHWWEVDLGEITEVTGVKINFTTKANYLYIIEVSDDGTTWRTALNCTGYTEEIKIKEDIFNEKARYVRIIYSGLPKGVCASHIEFMVFGK
jgi:hypothetical protein